MRDISGRNLVLSSDPVLPSIIVFPRHGNSALRRKEIEPRLFDRASREFFDGRAVKRELQFVLRESSFVRHRTVRFVVEEDESAVLLLKEYVDNALNEDTCLRIADLRIKVMRVQKPAERQFAPDLCRVLQTFPEIGGEKRGDAFNIDGFSGSKIPCASMRASWFLTP